LIDLQDAGRIIVTREKEPTKTWDGKWARAYGFADGHSEIHSARRRTGSQNGKKSDG